MAPRRLLWCKRSPAKPHQYKIVQQIRSKISRRRRNQKTKKITTVRSEPGFGISGVDFPLRVHNERVSYKNIPKSSFLLFLFLRQEINSTGSISPIRARYERISCQDNIPKSSFVRHEASRQEESQAEWALIHGEWPGQHMNRKPATKTDAAIRDAYAQHAAAT